MMIREHDVCMFAVGATSAGVFAIQSAEDYGLRTVEAVISCVVQETCLYAGFAVGKYISGNRKGIVEHVCGCSGVLLGVMGGIFVVDKLVGTLDFSTSLIGNLAYVHFACVSSVVSTVASVYFC